jgi:two-component system CheB/CheR fusion protein
LETANEELRSTNEELQSTNEEMQTSKEELQSVNEELATVNTELQTSISSLSVANDDMSNLLAGTGIGTLFLDRQLRITRFTPPVTRVINLISTDVGRPVGHIVSNLVGYDRLVEDAQAVLDMLTPQEAEVRTKGGEWLLMRILLYRTLQNVIEGVVITFVNITERKKAEAALREAQDLSESIVATVREPILVLDRKIRVAMANRAFYAAFEVSREETEGRLVYDLGNRQWDIPDLRRLLEEIIPQHSSFEDFEMTHSFPKIGQRTMLLNARRVFREESEDELILLAIVDITDRPSRDPEGNADNQISHRLATRATKEGGAHE